VVLWLLLTVVELLLVTLLLGRPFPAVPGLLLWAGWINPGAYNPALAIMARIAEPVLRPVRRLLPPMGGLDLSPMLAILGLYLAQMLIVAPLRDLARALAG